MVNFNTLELKVSISRSKADGSNAPLSNDSIDKLRAALVFAVNRGRDMLVILAFANYFLPQEAFTGIKNALTEKYQADFLHTLSDLIIIRTKDGNVVTVKVCSGSILVAGDPAAVIHISTPPPKKMRARPDAKLTPVIRNQPTSGKRKRCPSEEDIGELTQECMGLL